MFPCCRVFVQQQITDGVKVWLELKKMSLDAQLSVTIMFLPRVKLFRK